MNEKQRGLACIAGKPVDRNPVSVLYNFLYYQDHFAELTGLPAWKMHAWRYSDPSDYLRLYCQMLAAAPFELLQPDLGVTYAERERVEFIEKDGKPYRHDKKDGSLTSLWNDSGHPIDYHATEERQVFTLADIREKVKVIPAQVQNASGVNDNLEAIISALGEDHYIISGGVVGTLYSCGLYVGQTNALALLRLEPEFMDALCASILEQNIETIRALAATGGDAIYIDDATATSDMISPRDYERFSLPYMQAMVAEIQRQGLQAIAIYFGGVADRLDLIAETGVDALSVETSMKAYTNDIGEIARQIGSRVTLFGNIDPLGVLEEASDEALEVEMRRQAEAGKLARGFVMSTGSPITPGTPLARVRRFLELGSKL